MTTPGGFRDRRDDGLLTLIGELPELVRNLVVAEVNAAKAWAARTGKDAGIVALWFVLALFFLFWLIPALGAFAIIGLSSWIPAWLASLTRASETLVASGTRDALADRAREAIGGDCQHYIGNRYPFVPGATAEIPLQDFGELFARGGRFDRLFNESLARLVDTSRSPWRWREGPGMTPGPPGLPVRMEVADRIRRAYFRDGPLPEVRFNLRPAKLGGPIARVVLEVDGQTFSSAGGNERPMPMQWPGPTPGRASLSVQDANGVELDRITRDGEWALFRLLQAQSFTRQSEVDFTARYSLGGGTVELPLQAGSLRNPFAGDTVRAFRCGGGA